jgi:hypothetical protein
MSEIIEDEPDYTIILIILAAIALTGLSIEIARFLSGG